MTRKRVLSLSVLRGSPSYYRISDYVVVYRKQKSLFVRKKLGVPEKLLPYSMIQLLNVLVGTHCLGFILTKLFYFYIKIECNLAPFISGSTCRSPWVRRRQNHQTVRTTQVRQVYKVLPGVVQTCWRSSWPPSFRSDVGRKIPVLSPYTCVMKERVRKPVLNQCTVGNRRSLWPFMSEIRVTGTSSWFLIKWDLPFPL